MTQDVKLTDTAMFAANLFDIKYANRGETFYDAMVRIAAALGVGDEHRRELKDALLNQRFLPAGRIQRGAGSVDDVTLANCFVSPTMADSTESIFQTVTKVFQTLRRGGGVGIDFSNLRPAGANIASLGSPSSGPLAFMGIFDSVCKTVSSAGHRRGAMMGTLRVDHPDIEEFISAKHDNGTLTAFNMSVLVTDEFMTALRDNKPFALCFEGSVVRSVSAAALWDKIMRSTYDYAEPGVLFLGSINRMNNLKYMEYIQCTNPCAEQPLPANGACVLGSLNLVKFSDGKKFDFVKFARDVRVAIRALDEVHNKASMPLLEQNIESADKRRVGLGITGYGSLLTMHGIRYGSRTALAFLKDILTVMRNEAYSESIDMAEEKWPFSAYDAKLYMETPFVQSLPEDIKARMKKHGIRNSHLLSIAPTGTISMVAGNVSGGIEPVFANEVEREVNLPEGKVNVTLKDYAYDKFGKRTRWVADDLEIKAHIDTLVLTQRYIDSSVSKTTNVGPAVTWEEFKQIYVDAYEGGAKGCTTFRLSGKRFGMMKKTESDGEACVMLADGTRSCDE